MPTHLRSTTVRVRCEASAGATASPDVVSSLRPKAEASKFDWKANWYPVVFVNHVDDSAPIPFTLMGEPLVFWKDNNGEWNCVADKCPHRLAPLSEGRIDEEGRIECGYHGWAFNGKGSCESIPQARETVAAAACSSPRACVTSYKTAVAQGMLFVLPMRDPPATLPPLPLLPHIDEPGWVVMDVSRDLPYDYATLLENVMDVSHVPFTHHLTVGNRKNAAPVELELGEEGVSAQGGFTGLWKEGPRRGALGSQFTKFTPPTLMVHTLTSKQYGVTETVVYAVPTTPGRCRILARFPFKFSSPIPMFVIKNTPIWLNHQGQNRVLEDDQIFLHVQERVLEQEFENGKSLAQACYLPTPADVYVSAFRKWLGIAGGSPAYPPNIERRLPPPTEPRDALLDRYNSHTRNCKHCMKALDSVRFLKGLSMAVGAAVALVAGGSLVVAAMQPAGSEAVLSALRATAGWLAGVLLSFGAWVKLGEFEKNFLSGPYPPPRNNLSLKANKRTLVKRPAAEAAKKE